MSDNEKYVFRLYNIGVPNKHANAHFGKDMSDKTYLGSPYVVNYTDVDDERKYRKIGETIHDSEFDDDRFNTAIDHLANRPSDNITSLLDNNIAASDRAGNLLLPHRGISVISLADPFFSFYSPHDIQDEFIKVNNNRQVYINKKLIRALGDNVYIAMKLYIDKAFGINIDNYTEDNIMVDDRRVKDLLDSYMNSPFITIRSFNDLIEYLNADMWQTIAQHPATYTDANNYNAKDKSDFSDYDFNYSQPNTAIEEQDNGLLRADSFLHRGLPYEQLLRRIGETWHDTNANGLVLASVPESAFYNVKDAIDGKLRAQRDYPEELAVKQLTPRKIFGMHNPEWGEPLEFIATKDRDGNISKPKIGWGKYGHGKGNHIYFDKIINFLNSQYVHGGKTPKEVDNLSQEIIHRLFGINPTDISDENKKFIFDDLSNWYKGYSDKKESKHNNILSGIKELGQ